MRDECAQVTDMNDQPEHLTPAVDKLAKLLSRCAVRQSPAGKLQAEVRAAVHAEWLHLNQMRKTRRQRRWLAAAAVLIIGVGVGWVAHNFSGTLTHNVSQPALMIATVTQLHGAVTLNGTPVSNHEQIREGDTLRSAADGGARIELNNGMSARVAAASSLHWLKAGEVQLTAGSLYVDSHARAVAFVVHTERGDVTHLGTRYLVSANAQTLSVSVRDGQVTIHTPVQQLLLKALQQVQLHADASIVRGELRLDDPRWQWVDALSEPFMLDNRSVAEFLQWVADETGYELIFSNSMVKAAASRTVLHGRQTTQPPLEAMQVVLAATDFHAIAQGKQLLITQQQ
jgi:ferric-dicitrate binding protein FerR (iron transport regulator)